jgi:hypothetical protein
MADSRRWVAYRPNNLSPPNYSIRQKCTVELRFGSMNRLSAKSGFSLSFATASCVSHSQVGCMAAIYSCDLKPKEALGKEGASM